MSRADVLITGGTVFDGLGSPPVQADVAITGGIVTAIGPSLDVQADRVIDAAGRWVTPGFIDLHAHYDLELEAAPGLDESLRHGVTTVVVGNCSLSAALCDDEALLDLFCRVESLPRELVQGWLSDRARFDGLAGYAAHLEQHPLGPNVASFLGHSELRVAAMGWQRAMTEAHASEEELQKMESLLSEALDLGFLGLSVDLLPWHRVESGPFQGEPVPSHQAAWSEVTRLARVLRSRDRVMQATPNGVSKLSVAYLFWLAVGLWRNPLRVTVVSAMDIVRKRATWRLQLMGAWLVSLLGGDFKWQILVEPFLNFADGVNTPIFEEFPSGVFALGQDEDERRRLFGDPEFRAAFRREWTGGGEKMFHCDFERIHIEACPDRALAGRTVADVAGSRDALDVFMDLLAEHGSQLRWKTVVGNDRDDVRRRMIRSPHTLAGFNDSGAHNQQMSFTCGALSLLEQVVDNPGWMTPEQAVYELTGRLARWLGLDIGTLRVGDVADIAVISPERLQDGLSGPLLVDEPRFGQGKRLVRRSDGIVDAVLVGGRVAFAEGAFAADLGSTAYGRRLRTQREAR